MKQVYKVYTENEDMKHLPPIHFDTQQAAENFVAAITGLLKEGKTIEWKAEIIDVYSNEDSFQEFVLFFNLNDN